MDRIRPDYSVRVGIEGTDEGLLFNPKYDRIDLFPWIGHAIMRVLTEEGMLHVHVDMDTAFRVQQATEVPTAICEFIVQSDYETYLAAQTSNLDESWFGIEAGEIVDEEVEDGD